MYSFWLLIRQDQSTGYAATYLPDTPEMIIPRKNAMIQFLKGKTNARYSPAAIMSITAYLEWEASCGKALDQVRGEKKRKGGEYSDEEIADAPEALINLECGDKGLTGAENRYQMYEKFKAAFADTLSGKFEDEIEDDYSFSQGHGSVFHMAQIARYQMLYRAGGKPIKAIEGHRRIWLYVDEDKRDDAEDQESQSDAYAAKEISFIYDRNIDLVIGEGDEPEQWIELKSLKQKEGSPKKIDYLHGKTIERWNLAKGVPGPMSLHRQYSVDRAAAYVGHARLIAVAGRNPIVKVDPNFRWVFQKFDAKWTPRGQPQRQEKSVELGSKTVAGTVRGDMAHNIARSDFEGNSVTKLRKANMGDTSNTNVHIIEADATQLLRDLISIGFTEALDGLQVD